MILVPNLAYENVYVLFVLLAGKEVPSLVVETDDNVIYYPDRFNKTVNLLSLNTRKMSLLIRLINNEPLGLAMSLLPR